MSTQIGPVAFRDLFPSVTARCEEHEGDKDKDEGSEEEDEGEMEEDEVGDREVDRLLREREEMLGDSERERAFLLRSISSNSSSYPSMIRKVGRGISKETCLHSWACCSCFSSQAFLRRGEKE